MSDMEGIERVDTKDLPKYVGECVILWRNKRKTLCRVESVDEKEKRLIYEVMSGPDKGSRIRSRYDTSQKIYLCKEEELMMGIMFVNA